MREYEPEDYVDTGESGETYDIERLSARQIISIIDPLTALYEMELTITNTREPVKED